MSDMKISLCVLCGLPAAGKSAFQHFLTSILMKNYDYGNSVHNAHQQPGSKSDKETDCSRKIVGVEYDILLPHQSVEAHSGDISDVNTWKSLRQDIILLINILIQSLQSSKWKDLFHMSPPQGIKDDLWKRFISMLTPLAALSDLHTNEVLIIIDDNMHLRSMRYEYYKLARAYSAGYCQIFLEISAEEALERNSQRIGSDRVSNEVITKMAKTFEVPDGSKNSWEKFSLKIPQGASVEQDEMISFIQSVFSNPVPPILKRPNEDNALSREQCLSSLLHQADLVLRKCVSAWLAECKSNCNACEMQQCVKKATQTKDSILHELRNGQLDISINEVFSLQAAQNPDCAFYKFIESLFLQGTKS